MSVFYGLLYQYFSIQGSAEFFHKTKTIVAMFVFAFLYPVPLMVLVAINYDHDFEAAKLRVQETAPFAYDLFITGACDISKVNLVQKIWHIQVVIQMGLIYVIAILFAWKIRQKLKGLRHSMSPASMKAQKQVFFALIVQLLVPLVFIVIPVAVVLACIMLEFGDVAGLNFFPLLPIHSF